MAEVGSRITVIDGAFSGSEGIVSAVDADEVTVMIELFGRTAPIRLDAEQLVSADEPSDPDAPFRTGDEVFVHEGQLEQRVGRVAHVRASSRKCVVKLEPGGLGTLLPFDRLSLRRPHRRDLLEDYRAAIARAVPIRDRNLRLRLWWGLAAMQAHVPATLLDRLAAGEAAEAALEAACTATIAAEQDRLVAAFGALDPATQAERWAAEWEQWCGWRSALERYFAEDVVAALLAASPCPPDHEPAEWARHWLSRGDVLWDRCEKHAERLLRPGNAYDAVPYRVVDLAPRAPVPQHPVAPPPATEDVAPRLASLAALRTQPFDNDLHRAISNVELELVATGDPDAVRAVVEAHRGWLGEGRRIEGWMLLDRPGTGPWRENPWHIPSGAGLDAVRAIWSPLAGRTDRWIAALERWTLGLVLLRDDDSDTLQLGYLHLVPSPSYELDQRGIIGDPPSERPTSRALRGWHDRGALGVLLGGPPHDPADDALPQLPGFRLPVALRELYAVHGGIGHDGVGIRGPGRLSRLLDWELEDELQIRFDERNPGRTRDELVELCDDGFGNVQVFDRARLDDRGDPLVADWDHETWEFGTPEPFRGWFDRQAPGRLLGVDG